MITKLSIICVLWSSIISVLKTKYIAFNISLNFSNAENHCKSLGTNLASLHSSQDMIQAKTKCNETGTLNCWIGLIGDPIAPGNDIKNWKWTDGTSIDFGFVNNNPENPTYGAYPWDLDEGNHEPNNGALNNITENCVELWQTELKWNDWQCKEEYYFLCNPIRTLSPSTERSLTPTMGPIETALPTPATPSPSMKQSLAPTMGPIEAVLPTSAPTVYTFPYIASHDARNFSQAEKYCESLGTNLASLHSSEDMTHAQTICHQTGTLNCWIGLQGTPINPGNDTKHWQWTDKTVTDFGFVNNNPEKPTYRIHPWDLYEPNNGALVNITENCVELWQTGLKWNDWQCKEEYYFLCNPIRTLSPSMTRSLTPTTVPIETALPTPAPTVAPTTTSAILKMRCDNIGNVNISYDGLVFEQIGYIDDWTKELRLQLLNIERNTVIIFTCRDIGAWGGFIANIHYEGTDYSTTNASDNLYTVISASDNVTSPLYFREKWYRIWRQHMNESLLPNKSYWIWNTNQSNKNNTMVFQFNFTTIIAKDNTRGTAKININIIFIIIAIVSGLILLLCLVFIYIRCRKKNKVDDLRFTLLENGDEDVNSEFTKWDVNIGGFTKGAPDNPKLNEEEMITDQEVNDTKYRMKMNMHGGIHTDTAGVVDFTAHSVNVEDDNIRDENNSDDDLL